MACFKTKAICKDAVEFDAIARRTRGGDGFPRFGCQDFPVLVLEADNPNAVRGEQNDKTYILLSAKDVRELLTT